MSEATFFLFKALMDVFTLGVVFNFMFRLLKVDYYNPLVQIRAVDLPSQFLRSAIKLQEHRLRLISSSYFYSGRSLLFSCHGRISGL